MNNCLCCFNLTGINEPREVVKEINGKEVKHTVKFTPEDNIRYLYALATNIFLEQDAKGEKRNFAIVTLRDNIKYFNEYPGEKPDGVIIKGVRKEWETNV